MLVYNALLLFPGGWIESLGTRRTMSAALIWSDGGADTALRFFALARLVMAFFFSRTRASRVGSCPRVPCDQRVGFRPLAASRRARSRTRSISPADHRHGRLPSVWPNRGAWRLRFFFFSFPRGGPRESRRRGGGQNRSYGPFPPPGGRARAAPIVSRDSRGSARIWASNRGARSVSDPNWFFLL